jgi:eukaryotic-like serine/threonine-protein kinase
MSDESPKSDNTPDEDLEVARALNGYLAELEAGRPADPGRLLAEHPAIAARLRSALGVMHLADRVAGGAAAPPGTTLHAGGSRPLLSGSQTAFWPGGTMASRVFLRQAPGETDPMVRPWTDSVPAADSVLGRYRLVGEIARGGMGAVLQGRDVGLGRDLAIKVMLGGHRDDPEVVRRFVEEAQIGGQLQHPGVVPVYELGELRDRQPYFTMKLVRGRTLAALLKDRSGPANDLPRFVQIFEQVCQPVAYAHARGVIHRDLKPSNVMVGSFGEVQVMDWGLAKVLPQGGVADEVRTLDESVVRTVRSGPGSDGSRAGSVLGTPAYMAPEQARGEVARLDERCDVFGLGAILCEVLTGSAPYTSSSYAEVCDKSARGDLAEAMTRLEACGSDIELIELARDCLAAEPAARPRDAGVVARRLTAHLAGVQERLRAAELARVEAQARAESERARRRLTVALAAALLGLVAVGGGSYVRVQQGHAALVAKTAVGVNRALDDAARLRGEALASGAGTVAPWAKALDAARRAHELLKQGEGDAVLRARVAAALAQLGQERAAAEADVRLLAELESIRGGRAEDGDPRRTDSEYAAAFRKAGLDVDRVGPKLAGAWIAGRARAAEVLSYVDDWAIVRVRAEAKSGGVGWRALIAVAREADPDRWRNAVRASLDEGRVAELRRLADDPALGEQPAMSLLLLAIALQQFGEYEQSEKVLWRAWRRDPSDFWVNFELADAQTRGRLSGDVRDLLPRPEVAARFLTAAIAIRPQSAAAHNGLGMALQAQGSLAAAADEYLEALRLNPADACAHHNLGGVFRDQRNTAAAEVELREALRLRPDHPEAHMGLGLALRDQGKRDAAVAELREAIRLRPDYHEAHSNLGSFLREMGNSAAAEIEFRAALRLRPDAPLVHYNLGIALGDQGKPNAAEAEFRAAIKLRPDYAEAHNNLGNTLRTQGKTDAAEAEFRAALRLRPDYPEAHSNLGLTLLDQGKTDAAEAEFREALRLLPDLPKAHIGLGLVLRNQGKTDAAAAEFREALRLLPDSFEAHFYLGTILRAEGQTDAAKIEFRAALRLRPDDPAAHYNLGNTLSDQGDTAAAEGQYREALRLKPDYPEAHNSLGTTLRDQGKKDDAEAEYREALRLKPDSPGAHSNLGQVLGDKGKTAAAEAEYREALRLRPDLPEAHNNLGNTLLGQGKTDAAEAEFHVVLRLRPDNPEAHYNLGNLLRDRGKTEAAEAEFREVLRLRPDYPEAHCNLGHLLRDLGDYAGALAELERGHELGSRKPRWPYPSVGWVRDARRLVALNGRLPGVLKGEDRPADSGEAVAFATIAYKKGLYAASARFFSEALAADRRLADDMDAQNRYNAACAAALAASGRGKDEPPIDDNARVHWRKQALDGLKADLTAWADLLGRDAKAGPQVVQTLSHWKLDPDLAGLRDAADVAALPEAERAVWRAHWTDVDALLKRARSATQQPN